MCSVISITLVIISLVIGKNVHETNALMKKPILITFEQKI